MLFNSLHFAIFFPLLVGVYFALSPRRRWLLLLAGSYYFYMCWKPEYLLLILASTFVDYVAALRLEACRDRPRARRGYLCLSLATNLGLLFAFKYFNFFNESARAVFHRFNLLYDIPAFEALLPVGISFYTFQTLSYTIDVYRGHTRAERHLGIFALYVAFFPQLVAGPIERSPHLLPQFKASTRSDVRPRFDFDYERVTSGLKLMLWGFFKKLVIADRVGLLVDEVYNSPTEHSGITLAVASYFFAFQIFCDFSGYSDIAIGSAKVMGFDLMENFRRPYFSKSIAEFWRRWHISLSSWFRDYLYIPLGGSKRSPMRRSLNVFIVFLVSGLWHGASWTFVVWGGLHGLYMLASRWTAALRRTLSGWLRAERHPSSTRWVQVALTFNLVTFAWIFFRANTLQDAIYIVTHLHRGWDVAALDDLDFGRVNFGISVVAILLMESLHLLQRRTSVRAWIAQRPVTIRWAAYYALALGIVLFGSTTTGQFIYFQF